MKAADCSNFQTRSMVPQDSHFLYELFCDVHAPKFEQLDPSLASQILRTSFHAQTRSYDENHEGLRRTILETTDGHSFGRFYFIQTDTSAHVVDISMLTPYRGQGIGTRLMTELQARTERITLTVDRQASVFQFYQKLGFVETGGDEVNMAMCWSRSTL